MDRIALNMICFHSNQLNRALERFSVISLYASNENLDWLLTEIENSHKLYTENYDKWLKSLEESKIE